MDRSKAASRLIAGSIIEVIGLCIIVFVARSPDGFNMPLVALGAIIFAVGGANTVLAALQMNRRS